MTDLDRHAERLEHVLREQLSRLRSRFLAHGLGWVLGLSCLGLLVYYPLDRSLHLPVPVRLLLSLGLAVALGVAFVRRVLYPQRRALSRDDAAILVERRFPELHERLISAVQLRDQLRSGQLRNQSAAMIARLVEDAEAAVTSLPVHQTLDPRRTRNLWLGVAGALLALVVAFASDPASALVFAKRVLGSDVGYPRLTTLQLELDPTAPDLLIEVAGRQAKVTMASGGELAVVVKALGKVPRDVQLVVTGARGVPPTVAMAARGEGRFRHVFRRVVSPMRFYARGGDDDRGDLDVHVEVVRPPAVGTIRATVQPPAYTRREPFTVATGSLEAWEGSKVTLEIAPLSPGEEGAGAAQRCRVSFLESGRQLELTPITLNDDGGTRSGYRGEFVLDRSERYEIDMIGAQGLRDPRPSTYSLVSIPDYPPVGRMLLPAEDSLNIVLAKGVVPIRVEAKDDHGLASIAATLTIGKANRQVTVPLLAKASGAAPLREAWPTDYVDLTQPPPAAASQPTAPAPQSAPSTPVTGLATAGEVIQVAVQLRDEKPPNGATTPVPGRTLHVVGDTEFARRVAGHFRGIRDEVEQALTQQQERLDRTKELVDDGDAERLGQAQGRATLIALGAGQGRVQSAIERVHQELMRSFTLHLLNRVDESQHAATALELWRTWHQKNAKATPFDPAFFALLDAERRAGRLGTMEKVLDPILAMLLRAQRLAGDPAPAATRALAEAGIAEAPDARKAALQRAAARQAEVADGLKALLASLDEWNEFQDVVTQTRAVRDKQRDIMSRTRTILGGSSSTEANRK